MNSTIPMSYRLALVALSLAGAATLAFAWRAVTPGAVSGDSVRFAIAALSPVFLVGLYFHSQRHGMRTLAFASLNAAAVGILSFVASTLADSGVAVPEVLRMGLRVGFTAAIVWVAMAAMKGQKSGSH